jgi:MerR family transcriptional regulator, light-induced transcriptional regulator
MSEFAIKAVAHATGLTVETLRAWERRYEAVVPRRDSMGRRAYSAADITRLRLLRSATELGHPISKVARLGPDDVARLVSEAGGQVRVASRGQVYVDRAVDAAQHCDSVAVEETLLSAIAILPPREVASSVIAPVLTEVGERWHRAQMTIAQEHMVSDIVRRLITNASRSYFLAENAPCLVLTTCSGERHELGILLCLWLAATRRCRTHYLGPDTPVHDIVQYATEVAADAVLISIVMPEHENPVRTQLGLLAALLQPRTEVWVGGREALTMTKDQLPLGSVLLPSLTDFEQRLDLLMMQ